MPDKRLDSIFANHLNTEFPVGICNKLNYFCKHIIVFFAIREVYKLITIGAVLNVFFNTAFSDSTPASLFIHFATGAFAIFKFAAIFTIKATKRYHIFFINSSFHFFYCKLNMVLRQPCVSREKVFILRNCLNF